MRWQSGANWGKGKPRKRTSPANWKEPLKWARNAAEDFRNFQEHRVLHSGGERLNPPRRPRVFCASLADWLDPEVPIEWLADLLALIGKTRELDWLLLTKRPELWRDRLNQAGEYIRENWRWIGNLTVPTAEAATFIESWLFGRGTPENVWAGTSVEDQTRADSRIKWLLQIPAKVRFLSCEPLLEAVNVASWGWRNTPETDPRVNWVICGGESGPNARTMEEGWARNLAEQCKTGGVPFFMKQMGGRSRHRDALEDIPADLRIREFPT